jgi:hypothetical protein
MSCFPSHSGEPSPQLSCGVSSSAAEGVMNLQRQRRKNEFAPPQVWRISFLCTLYQLLCEACVMNKPQVAIGTSATGVSFLTHVSRSRPCKDTSSYPGVKKHGLSFNLRVWIVDSLLLVPDLAGGSTRQRSFLLERTISLLGAYWNARASYSAPTVHRIILLLI